MKLCKYCGIQLNSKLKSRNLSCSVCKNGLYRYNLTRKDQLTILENQNNQCKICDKPLELFKNKEGGYIDHDHSTNRIRGVLCHPCNTVLGYFENHNISLERLQDYIKS